MLKTRLIGAKWPRNGVRSGAFFSTFPPMEIDDWRMRIDELNDELIALLNRRAVFATEIGKIKRSQGLPVLDRMYSLDVPHLSILTYHRG